MRKTRRKSFSCNCWSGRRCGALIVRAASFARFCSLRSNTFSPTVAATPARSNAAAGRSFLASISPTAKRRYRHEPADRRTPEAIFARRWALTVLEQTLQLLQAEFTRAGKGELFEAIKNHLGGNARAENYRALAAQLAMSEGAVKTAIHRLRKRYRELLHAEVAQTVSDPAEVKEELRELQAAISG